MVPAPTTTNGSASQWAGQKFTHIIDGKAYEQANAKMLDVINPATEKVVAQVPIADQKVVDDAVKAARAALPAWRKLSWAERKAKMNDWHEKAYKPMMKELIPLYTAEQGRPLSMAELEFGIVEQFWNLDAYPEPKDEVISDDGTNKNIIRMYPIGVSAALVPWNYPLILTLWKVIPALLTGCTVIVKPSPFTPLMTLKYMLEAQKHLPPGVLNVVVGNDGLGPMLTEHPNIDHISFTGSTATGRLVARSCAATLKRVTLELGGNDACIVLPGIDFNQVPLQVFISALQNSGQFCSAAKRIYVHESIYDQFSQVLTAIVNQTKLGDGSDPSTGMGPVVNRAQFNKVNEFLLDIQKNGQKTLTGGKVHEGEGYFVPITVVDNPPENSKIVTEEPFGPVVPLLKFSTEEEVIQRANASAYGLGGQVWGGDIAQCERIADQLETGTVWVNQMQNFDPMSYFGGWKQSGVGGANGKKGLEAFMQPKTIKIASKVAPFPPPASH